MNNALDIKDLSFHWAKEDKFFLKIKKFSIEKSKKVVLFGESGSGKSTLLNLISGILSPVSGTISVKNNLITNLSQNKKDEFRANNIGVIFQQFNILDYISPLKNILLPCYFTDFKKKNKNYFYQRAFELANMLKLNESILLQKTQNNYLLDSKSNILEQLLTNHF